MRNAGVAVVAVVISIFSVACGSAKAGGSCSQSGFLCQDPQNALECRVGTWLDLPCRGPAGCTIASGTVSCDMSGDQAGDACASTAEGKGLCTTAGTAVLECQNGVLALVSACTTCTVSSGQVVCQQ